ncbi:MAG: iron-sulfur cluster assembly scaffold protein [Planctomycetaceae bacterium]|nr:iron-sulfur cluster assembly scaffold protein [Planctomycetaceae bacterium]MCA9044123.1 iron-sulfur cluster assembly scaffold protein [Planctomycetaceae bacterium]
MTQFSATLMEHFQAPLNRHPLDAPDGVGLIGTPGQGMFFKLYLNVAGGFVEDAGYECNGCGVTVACGSALTEHITGRSLDECQGMDADVIAGLLDGIPKHKSYCAEFAAKALFAALMDVTESLHGVHRG